MIVFSERNRANQSQTMRLVTRVTSYELKKHQAVILVSLIQDSEKKIIMVSIKNTTDYPKSVIFILANQQIFKVELCVF